MTRQTPAGPRFFPEEQYNAAYPGPSTVGRHDAKRHILREHWQLICLSSAKALPSGSPSQITEIIWKWRVLQRCLLCHLFFGAIFTKWLEIFTGRDSNVEVKSATRSRSPTSGSWFFMAHRGDPSPRKGMIQSSCFQLMILGNLGIQEIPVDFNCVKSEVKNVRRKMCAVEGKLQYLLKSSIYILFEECIISYYFARQLTISILSLVHRVLKKLHSADGIISTNMYLGLENCSK